MKNHMKRLAAPRTWAVPRKTAKFTTRPMPGAHSSEFSVPIVTILRDMLKLGETAREAKMMVKNKNILVDGKRVVEAKHSVGVMDTMTIKETNQHFRMLVDSKGKLFLKPIPAQEALVKVSKIRKKTTIREGKNQLGTHDGRTILSEKGNTGDSLLIGLPGQEVKQHLKLEKKALVFLTGGKHIGAIGIIEDVQTEKLSVKIGKDVVETLKKFAIVIGNDKQEITL